MDTKQEDKYLSMLRDYIKGEFTQDAALFASNAGGEAWTALEQSMWALQASMPGGLARHTLIDIVTNVPIARWKHELEKRHRGDS